MSDIINMDRTRERLDTMPDRPDGGELLDDTREFINRFCAFPSAACLDAVTLWAAHAHMVEHFYTTPRLALLSPEASSGKTRVLEVLDLLVPESMFSVSPSPATVFRKLAKCQITLLLDECDTVFTKRGKDDTNEDLRALINSGYKRGATIPRCIGPKHDVVDFEVFCATALAGLGDLPDTIMTRSIIIRMRPRAPDEQVEPFRYRVHEPAGHQLRDRLAAWSEYVGESAGEAWPDLPEGVIDRSAEAWEPLLSVADQAGDHWPDTARAACVEMVRSGADRKVSLGRRLLADLRTIFGEADAIHTETILQRLCDGEQYGLDADAPWSDLHGKPLNSRGLASMLGRYGVKSTKVKVSGVSLQGYRRDHLWEAWKRYLPSPWSAQVEPVEPVEQTQQSCGFQGGSGGSGQDFVPEPMEPAPDKESSGGSGGSGPAGETATGEQF